MSILNAFVSPNCGLIGVDTECSLLDGGYGEVSKLIPLVHMNAVVAFRGSVVFILNAATVCIGAGLGFDELAENMPELLKRAADGSVKNAAILSVTEEYLGCAEVVLVGFSPKMGRIVGHFFKRETLTTGFVTTSDFGCYVAPHWGGNELSCQQLGILENKAGMETLALTQSRLVREREPAGAAAGGRFVVAEIRRSDMTIESVCDFPARTK